MRYLFGFAAESRAVIVVEAEDLGPNGGTTRGGLSSKAIAERAQASFEDALEKSQPIAPGLIGSLRNTTD